jgi:hypothetical protein
MKHPHLVHKSDEAKEIEKEFYRTEDFDNINRQLWYDN